MPFDFNQPNYQALRAILSERTTPLVVFCGAGLSSTAGMPSWGHLKSRLIETAEAHLAPRDVEFTKKERALLTVAREEADPWMSFKHLRSAMGDTNYKTAIRTEFERALTVKPPGIYDELWRLPIKGFVTLNLDGLVSRSFFQVYTGSKYLRELSGIDCDRHPDIFVSGQLFVVNLHGIIPDTKSWVFTSEDFKSLIDRPAYNIFLQTLFSANNVLFIGISADDSAISRHLIKLRDAGFKGENHFWITHRADKATAMWANENGVRMIYTRLRRVTIRTSMK